MAKTNKEQNLENFLTLEDDTTPLELEGPDQPDNSNELDWSSTKVDWSQSSPIPKADIE